MIAWHHGHVVRRAKRLQPVLRHLDLAVERQVDEIAGDGKVAGRIGLDIGDDRVDDHIMHMAAAVALPVDVTKHALGREIAIGYIGQRPQMDIGNMCEPEHSPFLSDPVRAFYSWFPVCLRFRG